MEVSVIVPAYNEEETIGGCLGSLLRQTLRNMEIIVVDDGSTDGTKEVVRNFKVKLLEQRHKGAGAARNLGAKAAKGEILCFVDADMTFDKRFIEQLIEPVKQGELGSFSGDEFLANKENVWARCWNLNRGLPADRMHSEGYPIRQKVFRAILRSEFERVGGFDETAGYTDDWSLSEKLGKEAVMAEGAVFYHKNPGSLSEAFVQARWMAKRKYKLGLVGMFIAMVRVSLPVSLAMGIGEAIRFKLPEFVVFKLVVDVAAFCGMVEFALGRKVSK